MKIVHWTMYNSSGMNQVAVTMNEAEKEIGLDSHIANAFEEGRQDLLDKYLDADIHVSHTYFPEWFRKAAANRKYRLIWLGHGTPEHVFNLSVSAGETNAYGMNDGFMLQQFYLQNADAVVTHWPRHAAIYQTMVDRRTPVHVVPMGVDHTFWKPVPSNGTFVGSPSLFTAENCHQIKWAYDLFIIWGMIYKQLQTDATLHAINLPFSVHRWFFPLVNRNGSSYASHISVLRFSPEELRNAFVSTSFFIGLVSKGDFNRLSCEANACGAKTISYPGNPYSDFWVTEGDQRETAKDLLRILRGEVSPRTKDPIPDCIDTARQMKVIYETD